MEAMEIMKECICGLQPLADSVAGTSGDCGNREDETGCWVGELGLLENACGGLQKQHSCHRFCGQAIALLTISRLACLGLARCWMRSAME